MVLSLVPNLYDTFGLVAPDTVLARLLLKDIWELSGQQWDDDRPHEIVTKFNEWSKVLKSLSEIQIPRSYSEEQDESLELHMFGDSSQDVFSAVAFLRGNLAIANGYTTELAFVYGRARVATTKALTVPKLNLQALLLAARLRKEIENALPVRIEHLLVDGHYDSTSVAPFIREATCVRHQSRCRNPGPNNSG